MFFQNQTTLIQKKFTSIFVRNLSILTVVVLLGFCADLANADSAQTSTNVSPAKIGFKYQEIKAIAKKLNNQSAPEELEKLVEKSTYFIASFPEYKRVDEVYYRLGNALFRLERVEESIKVFEELDKKDPDARWVAPILLELGLAYDKLGKHDKADEAYNKLINHSKYGERSYAQHAKTILEQDKASRKGELPKPPGASSTPVSELVGKPAPDFLVTDLKGEELTLEKYRGQVVLLDFWATWCGPCIRELPNVKRTYEKYKDQKFQIIGISLDRSQQPLEAFIEREGLAWVHYWDKSQKITNQYGVRGIPSVFLIDGEGVIRKTNLRGHSLETAVAELVKENLAKPTDTRPKSIPATKLIKPSSTPQKTESLESLKAKMNEWVGKPAPDFEVTDLKGEELTLKKFRGQVVLLDFWATWCGPCLVEMPKVKKTYEKYKDQKFQIIGISRDNSKTPLEAYVEKEGLAWINYWDENGKLTDLYKVIGFPTTFLIDGAGVIRKASLGGSDVETAVAELVKENLAKPYLPEKTTSDSPVDNPKVDAKAKEIIDAAVAAHGGLDKLAAVKNIVIESHSFEHFPDDSVQDEGQSKTYYYTNKFRNDWYIRDSVESLIFDGDSLFQLTNGEAKPIPQERAKSFVDYFKDSIFREPIWLLAKLSQNDIPVQYLGTENVKGVPAFVLLVTQPSGKELKIFISKETRYVVQFKHSIDMGRETENAETVFEDYRDVDGIKIAYHRTTKSFEHRETLITDIKLNTEIDETLFSPKEANE
ncbi:MAG: redoxin domain-containing protein [Candidatus Poribacteria bacterium]|nr:redoxin domain-containing protein [Candidatus Poribacteria bacterium]